MVAAITLTVLLAASFVAANPIRSSHPRRLVEALENRGYAKDADILEPYDQYHARYMQWGCEFEHGQPFFDLCCHPKLKTDTTAFPSTCSEVCVDEPTSSHSSPAVKATPKPPQVNLPTPSPIANVAPKPAKANSPSPVHTTTTTTTTTTTSPSPTKTPQTGGIFNLGGFATYFYQGGNAGACGIVHQDTDFIVAIDAVRYGNLGAVSPLCGKKVEITNILNGKSVIATIADACPTCKNPNSIDLSQSTFEAIASLVDGMVAIKWKFVS